MHSRSQRGLRVFQYKTCSVKLEFPTERVRNQAFVAILASQQRHFEKNAAEQPRLHPTPLFGGQYTVTPSAYGPTHNH